MPKASKVECEKRVDRAVALLGEYSWGTAEQKFEEEFKLDRGNGYYWINKAAVVIGYHMNANDMAKLVVAHISNILDHPKTIKEHLSTIQKIIDIYGLEAPKHIKTEATKTLYED